MESSDRRAVAVIAIPRIETFKSFRPTKGEVDLSTCPEEAIRIMPALPLAINLVSYRVVVRSKTPMPRTSAKLIVRRKGRNPSAMREAMVRKE